MGIRTKILLGFMILACMLFAAGAWSIYELTTIGTSVQRLLDDNYRSINAAMLMSDSLEREDSAILLLLSGKRKEGLDIFEAAERSFQEGFQIVKKNVTIPGESAHVEKVEKAYKSFRNSWNMPALGVDTRENLDYYFKEVHQSFLNAKAEVEGLIFLNDQVMYRTASGLKNRARRAVMPGIVAILSALLFTLVFNYFTNYYLVGPIIRITKGIQGFLKTGRPFQAGVETRDELQSLAAAIQSLITRVKTD